MDIAGKTFNFVSILTALVVLGYVVTGAIAFGLRIASWEQFSGAIGPIAGTLLGYFLKGDKTT
jgi:hypothetical protein